MFGQFNNQWFNFSMGVVVPVIGINKIMIQTTERLANKQIDLALDYLELWRKQMNILADAKDKPASLAEEGKIIAGYGNRIIERADEFLKITSDARQSLLEVAADSAVGATRVTEQDSGETAKAA